MNNLPLDLILAGYKYSEPLFSPNGMYVAFLSQANGVTSLFIYDINDRCEYQLTDDIKISVGLEYGGAAFCWSSDSSKIIFSSEGELHWISIKGGSPKPIKTIGKAINPTMIDNLLSYVIQDGNSMSLVKQVWEAENNRFDWPIRLKHEADFIYSPVIHPSGEFIAFHSWDNPNMSWQSSYLNKIDLNTEKVIKIAGGEDNSVSEPRFSPDGKYLSYISEKSGWLNLWIANADGSNPRHLVDEEFEHGEVVWVSGNRKYCWVEKSKIVFSRNRKGITELCLVDVETDTIQVLNLPKGNISNLSSDGDGLFVFEFANYKTPKQLILADIEAVMQTSDYHILKSGGLQLGEFKEFFVKPQLIEWQDPNSSNGKLSGLYYKPTTTISSPPPLIMMVHGGPTSEYYDRFRTDVHYFTSKGWAVFGINYRGSTGNGRSFREQLNGKWGIYDPEDCKSALEYLIDAELAHKATSVIMGGSAGGLTVLMTLATYPGLFKAGIDLYGVSDLLKIAQDTHYLEAHYTYSIVAPLPEGRQKYIDQSPSSHAHKIVDSILILQGSEDTAVPPSQSEHIRDKVSGYVEYNMYEGEGHGFRKTETLKDVYSRIEDFLINNVLSK